jgi:hypothetical protein
MSLAGAAMNDARRLALFRALYASVVLVDLFRRLRDFHSLYTDNGILPRRLLVLVADDWSWSLFNLGGSAARVGLLVTLTFAATLALAVGFRTRFAAWATWALLVSFQRRNPFALEGGDAALRVLGFWLACTDSGAVLSFDAWWSGPRPLSSLPLRLLQAQALVVAADLLLHHRGGLAPLILFASVALFLPGRALLWISRDSEAPPLRAWPLPLTLGLAAQLALGALAWYRTPPPILDHELTILGLEPPAPEPGPGSWRGPGERAGKAVDAVAAALPALVDPPGFLGYGRWRSLGMALLDQPSVRERTVRLVCLRLPDLASFKLIYNERLVTEESCLTPDSRNDP